MRKEADMKVRLTKPMEILWPGGKGLIFQKGHQFEVIQNPIMEGCFVNIQGRPVKLIEGSYEIFK